MATFRLGINMPGAISAGAYTAGVLDFLTEALDAWYAAKARGEAVPQHDVVIDVMTGASAGGMCAAISSVLLQDEFEHIHDATRTGTTNRFYESWVNRIDIGELLKTQDLARQAWPVVSLLDSTVIEGIAKYALTRGEPLAVPRPYVSRHLTLFLSLTSLRGVPYALNGVAPGAVEQTTVFYGDRIRFEVSDGPAAPLPVGSSEAARHVLDLRPGADDKNWTLLQTAAMATGAFPVFLAPRVLTREKEEYTPPVWEGTASKAESTPPPLEPHWPAKMPDPFQTVNVDGGVTNNDPYNYAHDYLMHLAPAVPEPAPGTAGKSGDPRRVDRAVLTIAPFPTTAAYTPDYDATGEQNVLKALPRLFAALIAQSRFFGENLGAVMQGTSFDNFLIAPKDSDLAKSEGGAANTTPALQCAALGAFGGFFEVGFRRHDFLLGRRNCQKFLMDSFVLPVENLVMAASLPEDAAARERLVAEWKVPAPEGQTGVWMPLVPLCGDAVRAPMPGIPRAQMSRERLDEVIRWMNKRTKVVVWAMLNRLPPPLRWFLKLGQPFIRMLAARPLRAALIRELGTSYKG